MKTCTICGKPIANPHNRVEEERYYARFGSYKFCQGHKESACVEVPESQPRGNDKG